MKKFIFPILAVISAIQFISCNSAKTDDESIVVNENTTEKVEPDSDDSKNRYKLKSAIVTTKITMPMMQGDMINTLYFDNYGDVSLNKQSVTMTVMGSTMVTNSISIEKNGWIYSWPEGQSKGTKYKITNMDNDPTRMDYEKMSTEMMQQLGIKKAGTEVVMGKTCEKIEMNKEGMGTGSFWFWNNILLKSETNMAGMKVDMSVTDLKENADIPAAQFELPANVSFEEMEVPQMKF